MSRLLAAPTLLALALAASPVDAQTSTPTSDSAATPRTSAASDPIPKPANDSLFRRARRLVSEGNGVAGRALVDSLLRAADPATPDYGDALYWHGALAPTAAAAEADYRRVIVEYPLAYYSGDALLAIAELEQARGDRVGAMQHLQRFVREHPDNPGRGIAALGVARLAFEQRDSTLACTMLVEARRSVSSTDVELRNQIAYYGNRCASAPATVASAPSTAPVTPASAPTPTSASAPARPSAPTPATQPTREVATATEAPRTPARAATREPTREARTTSMKSLPAAPALARATNASTTDTKRAPTKLPTKTPTKKSATPDATVSGREATRETAPVRVPNAHTVTRYAVQVAAYDTRADADALVKRLAARGVKARVSGTSKPFRVRLGLHATRKEAIAELTTMQKRGINGFVADEETTTGARTP